MDGQRFIKGQRVVTPDGPGKVDGYGYPAGYNTSPSSIWVFLDATDGQEGRFRGYSLDAGVYAEPGAPEPTPLELAANRIVDSMRSQATMQNSVWWVDDLDATDGPNEELANQANQLAAALGQPPVWTFKSQMDEDAIHPV